MNDERAPVSDDRQAPEAIETERLVGRRLPAADAALFLAFHRDPRVVSWLGGGEEEITEEENREWLDAKLAHWERHGFGLYAWFAREPAAAAPGAPAAPVTPVASASPVAFGTLIGRAGIHQVDPDVGEVVGDPAAIELMYALAYDAWGHGYASEISRRLLEVARDDLGRTEIIADTVPHNVRSRRVMEGLGFAYEREFWHDDRTMVLYRKALCPRS
jgi:[ribosomal protein S5]-alanine N-acetyltransferase